MGGQEKRPACAGLFVYSPFIPFGNSNPFNNDIAIEKKSAVQNPSTEKSGTILAASIISNALITREKSPKVIIVSGRVRIVIIGLIKILIAPSTTASTMAPTRVTVTPGSK